MAYNDQIQKALAEPLQEDDIITLSSGVKLKRKPVPILRIQHVMDSFEYPEVPTVRDEKKGRVYKNPNSPTYLAAVERVDSQRNLAVIDAIAALGTELVHCPDNVPKLEDQDWIEDLKTSNIDVREDVPSARYLSWVKFVAIITTEDLQKIANSFESGTSEKGIEQQLAENFQSNT